MEIQEYLLILIRQQVVLSPTGGLTKTVFNPTALKMNSAISTQLATQRAAVAQKKKIIQVNKWLYLLTTTSLFIFLTNHNSYDICELLIINHKSSLTFLLIVAEGSFEEEISHSEAETQFTAETN